MKAIVQSRYCSPSDLELREIDRPLPGDDEVLVRVHAASVHPDVWHAVTGIPYVLRFMGSGVRRPKQPVPGLDLAGTVEATGDDVTRFQPGDEVFGEGIAGNQWRNGGTYAEYAAVPAEILAPKPANLTFVEAAAVPTSGMIALAAIRDGGGIEAGQSVLVNGAGGGVGTFAVQLANAEGAEVTGVDSGEKLDMLRSIGAETVLDYTETDFTRGDERYDLIVDVPGNHSFTACRRAFTESGTYVLVGHDHYGAEGRRVFGSLPRFLKLFARSRFSDHLPAWDFSRPPKDEAMAELAEILEAGAIEPVVDRTYPLSETVEAIKYLSSGAVQGKVVITV